ncbi:hypothetical protein C8R45DRAFT_921983 [Mycena sanguinolenta]|nr:hypothetical protein C8R45DRAFT_921983 [Mycena sanguinolenta]
MREKVDCMGASTRWSSIGTVAMVCEVEQPNIWAVETQRAQLARSGPNGAGDGGVQVRARGGQLETVEAGYVECAASTSADASACRGAMRCGRRTHAWGDTLGMQYSWSLAASSVRSANIRGDAPCRASALQWKYRAEGGADGDGVAGGVHPTAWGGDAPVLEPEQAQRCRKAGSKIGDGEVNCGSRSGFIGKLFEEKPAWM